MAEGAGSGARASGGDPRERALAALARSLGVARRELRRLRGHDYRHVFSHRVWHVALFAAWLDPADEERGRGHVRAETEGEGARERRWATAEELRALAMPRAFEPVRELVLSGRLAPRRGGAMMEGSREAR